MSTDATDIDDAIEIVHITNVRRQPVQIIVDEPEDSVGFTFFDQSGLVSLAPGETIEVERDRLNLGQIENLFKKRFLSVIFMNRDISGNVT